MSIGRILRGFLKHPSPVGNRLAAIARFGYRQAHKQLTRRPLVARWCGMRLSVDTDATSAGAAYYLGLPDYWEMQFLRRYLRPGDSVADVGANVGVYSLLLAQAVGKSGAVQAFEPDPVSRGRLLGNLSLNGFENVRVRAAAVGRAPGQVHLESGMDSVGRVIEGMVSPSSCAAEAVEMVSLDSALDGLNLVYCKVDVEGYEEEVIRGAARLMARGRPVVWQMEWNDCSRAYGKERDSLQALLLENGYGLFECDVRSWHLSARPVDSKSANCLAIRDTRFVEERLATASGKAVGGA